MKKPTKNQIVIGASYCFCAANCIAYWISSLISESGNDNSILILGAILIIMIPVSVLDPREEMRSNLAVLFSVFLLCLLSLLISVLYSCWWIMVASIPEIIILFIGTHTRGKNRKKKH